jgi:hypothetical protein
VIQEGLWRWNDSGKCVKGMVMTETLCAVDRLLCNVYSTYFRRDRRKAALQEQSFLIITVYARQVHTAGALLDFCKWYIQRILT